MNNHGGRASAQAAWPRNIRARSFFFFFFFFFFFLGASYISPALGGAPRNTYYAPVSYKLDHVAALFMTPKGVKAV
jgi:hypothetical protein